MSGERPTRDELRQGVTVEIVQDQEENPGEPLIGDVHSIITEEHSHPEGIKVRLESGVVGRVQRIATGE